MKGLAWIVGLAALWMAGCSSAPPPPAQPPPVPVDVVKVGRQTVPVMAEYVAHTQAMQEVKLVPRVEGVLEAVNFHNGSQVRQGDLLMQIQPTQYQAAVRAAEASLEKGRADMVQAQSNVADQTARAKLSAARANFFNADKALQRIRPLAKAHAVPQTDLDNAEANYETNKATVDAALANLSDVQLAQRTGTLTAQSEIDQAQSNLINANLNLSYTSIYSPLTGIVSFVAVDQGNYVSPSKTPELATVSTVDPMKVLFQLTDTDYLKVARRINGAPGAVPDLELYLSDSSRYPYAGRFLSIDRAVNPQTGTIGVEAEFPNPDGTLRPGQYARVEFPLSQQPNAIVIPESAIITIQGATAAYVVGPEKKIQQRSIVTGTQYGNAVVVVSGLNTGDLVVAQGVNKVKPDTLVAPKIVPLNVQSLRNR